MRLAIAFLVYLWNGIFEMNPRDKNLNFARIARELGISEMTAQNLYNSAMRKIRRYLLKNKQVRYDLQEGLDTLESFKSRKNERDITFKSED